MKKIICAVLAVLILSSVFASCSPAVDGTGSTGEPSAVGVYAELVAVLRAELEALKKEQGSDAEKYEEKIRELEDKLAILEASKPGSVTTEKPSGGTDAPMQTDVPLTYTEKDGKITVTGRKDEGIKVIVIPEKIDGKPVVAIADNAFAGTDITGITLPSGVTDIGWFAFFGCVSLMNVTLPDSVASIGYDAFANCPKLTVYCSSGSYSEKYAKSYGLTVVSS